MPNLIKTLKEALTLGNLLYEPIVLQSARKLNSNFFGEEILQIQWAI